MVEVAVKIVIVEVILLSLISMQVFGLLYRSEYKAEYIGRKPYIEYSSTILQCTVIENTIGWFPRAGRWRRVSSYRSISGGRFANTGGREGGVGTHSHHFMDRGFGHNCKTQVTVVSNS